MGVSLDDESTNNMKEFFKFASKLMWNDYVNIFQSFDNYYLFSSKLGIMKNYLYNNVGKREDYVSAVREIMVKSEIWRDTNAFVKTMEMSRVLLESKELM